MRILLFGIAKDIVGSNEIEWSGLEDLTTVSSFRSRLVSKYPDFKKINSLAIAVNEEYANDSVELKTDDTIAVIPPVSGG